MLKQMIFATTLVVSLLLGAAMANAQSATQDCSNISGNISTTFTDGNCWGGSIPPGESACSLSNTYSVQCTNTNNGDQYASGEVDVSGYGWAWCGNLFFNCAGPDVTCAPSAAASAWSDYSTNQLAYSVVVYSYFPSQNTRLNPTPKEE